MALLDGTKLHASDLPGAGGANVQTLAGNLTLTDSSGALQSLDCNGANRDVTLPTASNLNHPFTLINRSAAAYNLVVKNSGGTTILTIGQNQIGLVWSDSVTWKGETDGLSGAGTAFPGSPVTGAVFFRTDLGWLCFYDGTRWLTSQEYYVNLGFYIGPGATAAFSATGTYSLARMRDDYAPWFTRVANSTYISAPNNGSNHWTMTIYSNTANFASATGIYTFNTSGDTGGIWTRHEATPSTQAPATYGAIELNVTGKTGSPGTGVWMGNVYFRLIVT